MATPFSQFLKSKSVEWSFLPSRWPSNRQPTRLAPPCRYPGHPPPPPRSPISLLRPPPPLTGVFAVALNLVSPEPPHPAAFGLESEQIARPSHPPAALISLGRAVRGPAKRGTMPSLPRHLISSSPFCSFSGSHSGPPRSPSTAHSRLRPPSAGISHAPHSSASAPSVARPSPMAFSKVASPPLTRLQACRLPLYLSL